MQSRVQTDLSTEFGSNPILLDQIRIESAAGSNPVLIVQIRKALYHAVDFNEYVTAFATGKACMLCSDIKGGQAVIQLRCRPAHNQCSLTLNPLYFQKAIAPKPKTILIYGYNGVGRRTHRKLYGVIAIPAEGRKN